MITDAGRLHIKRYMAGFVPAIGQSIAFGIGDSTETVNDSKLAFEAGRIDVTLTSLDLINNRVIFKGRIPDTFTGILYEAALYSLASNVAAGQFGSKIITTFDSATEDWVDAANGAVGTYVTGNVSRIGADSLTHTPAASSSKTDKLTNVSLDFSGYSNADLFTFAFNTGNGNTASIAFRFLTNATNYYTFTLPAQTLGYKVVDLPKSAAVATGAPDWESINEISVTTTASSAGPASVNYDGIRVEDTDTVNPDYVVVSREVLSQPFVKEEGRIQDIEFSIDIIV